MERERGIILKCIKNNDLEVDHILENANIVIGHSIDHNRF